MREITLYRTDTGPHGTFGIILLPGLEVVTLELPWKDNARNVSCIPAGSYDLIWCKSRKYGRNMYLVHKVPNRSGIRIHSGNFAGDRSLGLRYHSYGCILPGKYKGIMLGQKAVYCSRFAVADLEKILAPHNYQLTIKELYK